MIFSVAQTRFEFAASDSFTPPPGSEVNLFRGALGAALRKADCPPDCPNPQSCPYNGRCLYREWFDPRWTTGPSGYRDAPRPFVLRWGGSSASGKNLFSLELISFRITKQSAAFEMAFKQAITGISGAQELTVERSAILHLQTEGKEQAGRLRLAFVTPIELKKEGVIVTEPDFVILTERLAERVWALGRLYQAWPESFGFGALLESARAVKLLNWEWTHAVHKRRSARSGKVHAIGGFTGWAEYEGPVGRLLPLLAIARWTGVGRQTVWGKGEIRVDEFAPQIPGSF